MAAKINMRLDKNEMPSQDPNVRNKNFLEVALGYTEEQALDEAARCLHCKNHPCVDGCPVNVRIPEFIAKIVERDYEGAYQVIHQTSSLPAVCGRVCPQESQCEMHCVRGKKGDPVGIGRLERFVADWHNAHSTEAPEKPQPNGHKVAVVGSGPAGLTCAGDLAKKGYEVTVFEALHLAGGVLVYGIPEFRLPKSIVQKEVDGLKAMGVKVETNTVVGRTITIDELMEENGFEAVFVGSGAGLPMFMHIPGENLKGVYSANEFLTRINLMKAYRPDSDTPIMDLKGKKVAVVGGGNVAMDAARCSKRLGADVYVVYRRGMEELPARHEEVEHAIEEGVVFKTLNNPVQINGDEQDCVKSMTCIEMALIDTDVRRTFATGIAGFSHVVDSLSAIRYARVSPVRNERGVTTDFRIEGDFPRYGNDDDRADEIAVWLLKTFMTKLRRFHTYRGSEPTTSILTITSNVVYGKNTGALPDGRKAFEPLSPGANPAYGAEKNGLLASLNSVAKLPYECALDGISNTQTISPGALGHTAEERSANLVHVLDGYFDRGAHHLNVNVFGVDRLQDAMDPPEKPEYANFTIRVSGYAVKFIDLTREQQLDVIARSAHERM